MYRKYETKMYRLLMGCRREWFTRVVTRCDWTPRGASVEHGVLISTTFRISTGARRPLNRNLAVHSYLPTELDRCNPWPHGAKPAIFKLLLLIYSFQFRSVFCAATTPSQPRPLQSLTHSWTHLWF